MTPSTPTAATPTFDPQGSRYDLSTYAGRVRHFLDVIDPRSLAYSAERVGRASALLREHAAGRALPPGTTDADLWDALKVRQAVINPGTGEPIPPPARMSAFVPMNVPILFGMLASTSATGGVFWQVVNQSYNSMLNYANRSGSDVSAGELAESYAVAVSTAVALSYGVNTLGRRGPAPVRALVRRVPFLVPYLAVAGAGAANVYASRRAEVLNGVPVFDAQGERVGVSREAAKMGVYKTILTRSLGLPLPVLVLPPLVAGAVVPANATRATRVAFDLVIITACLAGALPLTIAAFPQQMELDVAALEPEFRALRDRVTGAPVLKLYANKGL